METIGAIVAGGVVLAVGYYAGGRWAQDSVWSIPIGIVVGIACALAYLAVMLLVVGLWPHSLDAHKLGIVFMLLLIILPLLAVVAAWFGYRKSLGMRLF